MEKSNYYSLTNQLIQNGIINTDAKLDENIFDIDFTSIKEENVLQTNKNVDIPISNNKKRLNKTDIDLVLDSDSISSNKNIKAIKNFLDSNSTQETYIKKIYNYILIKLFPKIYKAKLVKAAMKKLIELDINTSSLFNKTIPYGENELRYNDLIKYLNCANDIQIQINNVK